MRIRSEWLRKAGGLLVSSLIESVMSTLTYRQASYDLAVDPAHDDFRGPAIFLFWHEFIPVPFYLRPFSRMALLVSRHADAEWLTQAVRYRGFSVVRGSSARGGTAALRELMRVAQDCNLAITPDGPRGPRRSLAQGPIYLSSELQIPLILIAVGMDRPWRLPTWDRFAIPRLGSRCRVITSPRIQIPPNLDRLSLESYRESVERLFLRLTEEAEAWAESGEHWSHSIPLSCRAGSAPWYQSTRDWVASDSGEPSQAVDDRRCA